MENSKFPNTNTQFPGNTSGKSVRHLERNVKKMIGHAGENSEDVFDVILLGVGSMGSSTGY